MVTLDRWPGMFHAFQLIPILPGARESLEKVADFIARKNGRGVDTILKFNGFQQQLHANWIELIFVQIRILIAYLYKMVLRGPCSRSGVGS